MQKPIRFVRLQTCQSRRHFQLCFPGNFISLIFWKSSFNIYISDMLENYRTLRITQQKVIILQEQRFEELTHIDNVVWKTATHSLTLSQVLPDPTSCGLLLSVPAASGCGSCGCLLEAALDSAHLLRALTPAPGTGWSAALVTGLWKEIYLCTNGHTALVCLGGPVTMLTTDQHVTWDSLQFHKPMIWQQLLANCVKKYFCMRKTALKPKVWKSFIHRSETYSP